MRPRLWVTVVFGILFTLVASITIGSTISAQSSGGSSWVVVFESKGWPDQDPKVIAFDHNGQPWIGTDQGLFTKVDDEWVRFNTGNSGLSYDWITAINFDGRHRAWIGTSAGGVNVLDGKRWKVYSESTLPTVGDHVDAISVDDQDRVWVGSAEGLTVFDNGNWKFYTDHNSPLPEYGVSAIVHDDEGRTWIGTREGVFRISGDDWQQFQFEEPGWHNNIVKQLIYSPEYGVWVGLSGAFSQGGLVLMDGGTQTRYTTENSGLLQNDITAIAIDDMNRLWVGTSGDRLSGGLNIYDGEVWRSYTSDNSPLRFNDVEDIAFDSESRAWIATTKQVIASTTEQIPVEVQPQHGGWITSVSLLILTVISFQFGKEKWIGVGETHPWRTLIFWVALTTFAGYTSLRTATFLIDFLQALNISTGPIPILEFLHPLFSVGLLGFMLGATQGLVLRYRGVNDHGWIRATFLGGVLGFPVGGLTGFILGLLMAGGLIILAFTLPSLLAVALGSMTAGVLVAIFQQRLLHKHFTHTGWWILATIGAIAVGIGLGEWGGLILGLGTGVVLVFVLKDSSVQFIH